MAGKKPLNILWFEDDPSISLLYEDELADGRLGDARVHLSTTLGDAGKYLERETPDILFTDVNLHGSGSVTDFIGAVQKKNPNCEIAFVTSAQKSRVHTWPGTHFVEKSSNMDVLFGKLKQIHDTTRENLAKGTTHQTPAVTQEYLNEVKEAHIGSERIARSIAYKRLAGTGTKLGEGSREANIGMRYAEEFLKTQGVNGRHTLQRKPWLSSKKPGSGLRLRKGVPR